MNIVWFSWKDRNHPQAGGAETVSSEIMERLARDGHHVHLITAKYPGSVAHEEKNNLTIDRVGNRFTIYFSAYRLFRKRIKNWPDVVIDEMNTIPFCTAFYARKKQNILLTYQLARKVWFYQMIFPFSLLGYLLEPLYLFVLSKLYSTVLTESNSTKVDLQHFGFKADSIHIFRVGMALKPLEKLEPKKDLNHVLFLGALRPMKQAIDAVKAFELARDINPSLVFTLVGDNAGGYGDKVNRYVEKSRHVSAITITGRVSAKKRLEYLRQAAVILVTSVKEGWGLIISEANSQGTPAIAYNADGLRDSVQDGTTGFTVPQGDIAAMSNKLLSLIGDTANFQVIRRNGWEWSKEFTFENSYADFVKELGL